VPSLAGQEPVYLVKAIKSYRGLERRHEDMVADQSDEEIDDIAAYYSVQQLEAAADETLALQELVANCYRCHGLALGKYRMGVPALDGQNREYLARVMKSYRDDDRGSSLMHKMSANYATKPSKPWPPGTPAVRTIDSGIQDPELWAPPGSCSACSC
jgi:cytochrome c553